MKGWIRVHRRIMDHWLYEESRIFSQFEAWLDLLLLATHKSRKIMLDGQFVEIKRGQYVTSIRKLSNNWGWSNSKVQTFLNTLELEGVLIVESDTKKTLITIDNYDFFQGSDTE